MGTKKIIKIGEMAKSSGLPIPTLRHYVKIGLIKVISLTEGGQYLFDEEQTLKDLKCITELADHGMKLQEIKDKFSNGNSVKKVLIIENDEAFAKLLKSVMGHICPLWSIEIVTDVFFAGHMLVKYFPDLVVLNTKLEGVNGFEICKFIKSNVALEYTKVIFLTAESGKETNNRMLKSGADTIFSKPLDVENFMNVIKILLNL